MNATLATLATGARHAAVESVTVPVAAIAALATAPVRLVAAHPRAALAVAITPPWRYRAVGMTWFAAVTFDLAPKEEA